MKLVTAHEMQDIDRRTIEGGHVPGRELMERAGAAIADILLDLVEDIDEPVVEILCGKGNNGGDGLVVARLLHACDVQVRVWLTDASGHAPDAQANLEALQSTDCPVRVIPEDLPISSETAKHSAEVETFVDALEVADVCVDALLGTGITRVVSERYAAIIDTLNEASSFTIAVDIPSGVDGNDGVVHGTAVQAQQTITIGLPKHGLVMHPGAACVGALEVVDIGFPESIVTSVQTPWAWFDEAAAVACRPRVSPTAHKYERGAVVVVAGSRRYPGAAALTAEAAFRSGAGIVHAVVPESISDLVNQQLREVIVHPAPETADGSLRDAAAAVIEELLPRAGAVAVGPGVSDSPATHDFLREFLSTLHVPHVIDADALQVVRGVPCAAARVLTPHAGELARMLGKPSGDVVPQRVEHAARLAAQENCVVLIKGAPSVTLLPTGERLVNSSGHPGLATAGSGDVLTGALAGLLARGVDAGQAAALAAYLHGRAADLLAEDYSSESLMAGDLAYGIGLALADLPAI